MVVVGANGSEKSTLFDVFGFLYDCLKGNVRQALDKRGRFTEVFSVVAVTQKRFHTIGIAVPHGHCFMQLLATYSVEIASVATNP